MQKKFLIIFLLNLNILISCNRDKNQRDNSKQICYYQIDTIKTINRFTGYYERSYNLAERENKVFKLNGDNYDLLEISWYTNDSLNSNSKLIYKTDLRNSFLLFSDYPYEIEYCTKSDSIYIANLSDRNILLMNFREHLNKVYSLIQKLNIWADSIKNNTEATTKNKQKLYQEYISSKHAINKRIDSLVTFIETIDDQDVKVIASLYLLTVRSNEIQILWDEMNWAELRLSNNLLSEAKNYINFRNRKNMKLPSFLEIDINGEVVDSKDLNGKYVLYDFWASYCGPCIQNSVKWLIPLYNKYNTDRLEIVGVSLDHDLNRWNNTVYEKKLPWININCKEYYSEINYLFNVREIPRMILVDENGYLINDSISIKSLKQLLEDKNYDTIY